MPGLSFICDFNEDLRDGEPALLRALDSTRHYPHFRSAVHTYERDIILACTDYEGYPFRIVETEDCVFHLEGMIYTPEGPERSLTQLSAILSAYGTGRADLLAGWLLENDGDYVVAAVMKRTGDVVIINDILGRLPLYYHRKAKGLVVSREIGFITGLLGNKRPDRMAMVQTLLVGFAWGGRTLVDDVKRLEPASLIHVGRKEQRITLRNLYKFNFDDKRNGTDSVRASANHLVDLFVETCRRRAGAFTNRRNILGLSGGLDSRAVGAALLRSGVELDGVTYLDHTGTSAKDAEIAGKIARALNIRWNLITLDSPKGRDYLALLRLKSGLNYLGMSYIMPFFEAVRERYGANIAYFTGDGGQILKPELRMHKTVARVADLAQHILSTYKVFSLGEAAALSGMPADSLMDDLMSLLDGYPEGELKNKYVHFLLYEENVNRCFEGEDRNRFFFWSITPFYSIPFFTYALNTPDHRVSRYALCREFLRLLQPRIASVDYARWSVPITSWRIQLVFLYHRIPWRLKMKVRSLFKKPLTSYPLDAPAAVCLRQQIATCSGVGRYISGGTVESSIADWKRQQLDVLLTVTSSIENIECGRSAFEQFLHADFR